METIAPIAIQTLEHVDIFGSIWLCNPKLGVTRSYVPALEEYHYRINSEEHEDAVFSREQALEIINGYFEKFQKREG